MRRVVGFDPSYQSGKTGYAVVEGDNRIAAYGVIRQAGMTDCERFASLHREVIGICRQFAVERAVVERPGSFAYRRSTNEDDGKPLNVGALIKNACAAAVILAALGGLDIRVIEVQAHLWKVCEGRNMNKEDMRRLAERQFPEIRGKRVCHHVCEAICLAALNT